MPRGVYKRKKKKVELPGLNPLTKAQKKSLASELSEIDIELLEVVNSELRRTVQKMFAQNGNADREVLRKVKKLIGVIERIDDTAS